MRYTIKYERNGLSPEIKDLKTGKNASIPEIALSHGFGKTREKGTILIAEDLESNYLLLKIMLAKNWKILWAKNGKEAVDMFESLSPDLILMDIKMPVMDGLEATRKIREKSRDIPIIAQTANAFESDRITALQAGCNDMLIKPIRSEKLNETINSYLNKINA